MVNKMKLKLSVLCMISLLTATAANASPDAGLRYINTRGKLLCGTQTENKIFSYKDEDGKQQGFNVEICKMISTAIFGRSDRFAMVPLSDNQVSSALYSNKIDVMIGGMPYSADNEISSKAAPIGVLYYDNQIFAAHKKENATSMEDYKGARVCVVKESDDMSKLQTYNAKYQLDFNILPFANAVRAKEAFFLKRCQLLTGNSMLLKDMLINSPTGTSGVEILPEIIASRPVYLYSEKNNTTFRSQLKWALNAIKLAEELGLSSENIDLNLASQDIVVQNLLGTNDKLWKKFKLEPNWVQVFLRENGNYGEVFENSLGQKSRFNMPRKENNLGKNGGQITSDTFI